MHIKKLITIQDNPELLAKYFNEIRNFPTLNKAQEKKLLKSIQKHKDKKALDELINSNLKFVVTIAKQYQGQGAPLMDLISQGNEGLIEAAYNFNVKEDIKFFSYAVWWIRKRIFTSIDFHKRTIQLPANRELLIQKVKKIIVTLEQKLERPPTVEEIMLETNKQSKNKNSLYDIYEAVCNCVSQTSLSDSIPTPSKLGYWDSDYTLEFLIAGDINIDDIDREESLSKDLNSFLSNIKQLEYDVLVLSLGLNNESPQRTSEIAQALQIKEKNVIKIKTRAMERLKRMKGIEHLKDYL